MRKLISILNLILASCQLHAQGTSSNEPEKVFSERIFVHTDKSAYFAGDTIWFKAYLFNGNLAGSASTDLYIDLVNEEGPVISYRKLAIIDGMAYGDFPLPDSLLHGFYFLRAYTRTLIAQGNKDGVIKPVAIINPDNVPVKYRGASSLNYTIQFFPESGSFVKGFVNSIIFRANDQYGNTTTVKGFVLNPAGDTLAAFQDIRDGIGTFSFTPVENEKYSTIVFFKDGSQKKYDLTVSPGENILLKVAENAKGKVFQVQKTDGFNVAGNLSLTGFMFNRVVFSETLQFDGNTANGLIPINDLPGGVLRLAITDNNKKVYAKRPVFIYRQDMTVPITLTTDTLSFLPKARNAFTLALPDSLEGNFSIAIMAYDENKELFDDNSIASSIFWDAEKDLTFTSRNYWLSNAGKQDRLLNDLLLVTEKQRPLQEINETAKGWKENYIRIEGDVFKDGTTKPVTEGDLAFLVHTKDSSSAILQATVQKDGTFSLDNMVFDDLARFNYKMTGKRALPVDIKIKDPGERYAIKNNIPAISLLPADRVNIRDSLIAKQWKEEKMSLISAAQGKMLGEVVVRTRVKRPVDIVNQKYARGLFGNMNASIFDFVNEPPRPSSQRILEYLMGRVSGLTIERRGGSYRLTSTRAMSITGGLIPVQIYLNEVEVMPDEIMTLTVGEIALVKYFKAGSNAMIGFGISGKLVIYTKAAEDINFGDVADTKAFFYRGYSSVQDFVPKDYSYENKNTKDNRSTLYWNPDAAITVDDKTFRFWFYNSDNARKFKIVVQGVTYDGRLVDFEKIISE